MLFAHPYFEYSTTNISLIHAYDSVYNLTFKDLYEEFEDFHITTFRERKRIREYERLIFHFPLLWFGLPPLLKLWIDEVFDMSWKAESDHPLANKDALIIVTVGADEKLYQSGGLYDTTIEQLMRPLELTLEVNGIHVKKILPIYNADDLDETELKEISQKITHLLKSNE